ncbi:hypothetical protein F5882DRAFT_487074 [Hyaloscypha sp. PMI_1271]|nr:hypothetical protein F5882DRAFT_487074 [Hyaloscypha sp. PMI_1271]
MLSPRRNSATLSAAPELPPTSSTLHPHRRSRKRHHQSPLSSSPHPKRMNIKDQRRGLTQSIISNLPRDELEKLLLDAALGNAGIMREVIRVNGLKRDISALETSREAESVRDEMVEDERQDVAASGDNSVQNGMDGGMNREDENPGSVVTVVNVNMDDIPGMGNGPLQFHHATHRQFEGRIAFALIPISTIIINIILGLTYRSKSSSINKLREKLKTNFKDIAALQLVVADAYLVTALMNQDHTSWFHFRFLEDPAIQSCLSAAILSLYFRRTGIEFWLHLLNVFVFIGLFLASSIIYFNKVAEALKQAPGCYDERFRNYCTPFNIGFGILIILFLLIPACIPAKFKLRRWFKVPLCVMSSLLIIVDNYLSFTDYDVMKVLLKSPETEADVGQTYTLLSAVLALVYSLYKCFVSPSEEAQEEEFEMHPIV